MISEFREILQKTFILQMERKNHTADFEFQYFRKSWASDARN